MSLALQAQPRTDDRPGQHISIGPHGIAQLPSVLSPHQQKKACDYIHQHLPERMALKEIAGHLNLSSSHFSRVFKNSLGISVGEWIHHQRVSMAVSLLNSEGKNISDIASECGFFDQSHFHRVFKKITGVTPGRWKRSSHATFSEVKT
ncbi:helix-turn-helix domain-containing protein [Herbaspirillum sp. NPDC087042]|uniref:helix-turn-helix domain-containing protein n=1 Tax=Herbaspirillum sp. NPDC087042 TaxID=3364004 RepID=UPI003820219D